MAINDPDVDAYVREAERRRGRWVKVGFAAAMVAGLVVVGVAFVISSNHVPAGNDRVLDTLGASGLRDPVLGGADGFACAESESSRHFTATNSLGKRVEGTVCCGLTGIGKGCTIRWGR
jgi:hypothetical protein